MKCNFTLEIECLDSIKNSLEREFAEEIETAFRIGLHEKFGGWQGQNFSLKLVEPTCGTPDNTGKKEEKQIKNSNDSSMESGDDYLGDRFNDLLER